jgi:hypothetical protein
MVLKFVILLAAAAVLAITLAPRVVPVVAWLLAFFSLLILGDLILNGVRRFRGGPRGR